MMSNIKLSATSKDTHGEIRLDGSKSISNRVLIIQALCDEDFVIHNLSTSDDTRTLAQLLQRSDDVLDAHHAGTTYRFLTSYLSTKKGTHVLTGSDRMKQRPIGPLVEALTSLGATISYQEVKGYPPLKITGSDAFEGGKVSISAEISSQFISSLLLIAPTLPLGMEIELVGDLVSRPYLMMTLRIMEYFGIHHTWEGNTIKVAPQTYQAKDFYVEADWSAASYYYSIAALSHTSEITLYGLQNKSLQADRSIADIAHFFGVETTFGDDHIRLVKSADVVPPAQFEYDFVECPDIAQTVMAMCAGLGTQSLYSGLQTLFIKETDRVAAMQTELQKVNVFLSKLPEKFSKKSGVQYFLQEGKASSDATPIFPTYHDHRMAMALAPLALLFEIGIEDKEVVSKSYPKFWEDFEYVVK